MLELGKFEENDLMFEMVIVKNEYVIVFRRSEEIFIGVGSS